MSSVAAGVGWLLVIIGFAVVGWGVFAIAVSAGVPPFRTMSLADIPTPMGNISTDDRQFAGGILLAAVGLVTISFGVFLLRQGEHGL
jgi:hypothetical protein